MNLPKPEIERDDALRLWISERSDYAKEQFLLNNLGIVGIVLKTLNLDPMDEDLFSTGLIGVIKAINTFDESKGFTFSAYATPIIRNEVLAVFRKKRIAPAFSLDEMCDFGNGEKVPRSDIIADERRFEEEVISSIQFERILGCIGEKEKKIISLTMSGKKQMEIADICGISQAQVSRIIKKTYEKWRRKNEL